MDFRNCIMLFHATQSLFCTIYLLASNAVVFFSDPSGMLATVTYVCHGQKKKRRTLQSHQDAKMIATVGLFV
jgi:hypothetical protein